MRHGRLLLQSLLVLSLSAHSPAAGGALPQDPPVRPGPTFFDGAPFDGAALDLASLADRIDARGAKVALVDALPAELVADARRIVAELKPEERDLLLQLGPSTAGICAAVAVLVWPSDDGDDATRRSLLACRMLGDVWRRGAMATRIGLPSGQRWSEDAQSLVREHEARFAAELLRGDLVPSSLRALATVAPPADVPRWRFLGAILRRLGPAADRHDWLLLGFALLAAGELDATERALAEAANAPPTTLRDRRHHDAVDEQALAGLLADARRWRAVVAAAGIDAAIAELRLLQLTDVETAVARSRAMCEAGVDHALPFSVLAADALFAGRTADVAPLLAAAEEHPGSDVLTATLAMLTRVVDLRHRLAAQPEDAEVLGELAAVITRVDGMLEGDPAEPAQLFLSLHRLGLTDPQRGRRCLDDLAAVSAVVDRFPDSVDAFRLLLATAANLRSPEAAAVFERTMSATLRRRPDLLLQRATVLCELSLVLGTPALDEQVEAALDQLAEAQGDALDAEYLRGVRAWSHGASRMDASQFEVARSHFHAARRMPAERGGFEAEVAAWIADGVLQKAPWELPRLMRSRQLAGVVSTDPQMEPVLVVTAALDGSTARIARALEALPPVSRYVVYASMAATASGRNDADKARAAAREALAIDLSGAASGVALAEHGVLASHQLGWDMNASVQRAGLDIEFSATLLPVSPIPSRARLEQLARD